MCLVPGTSRIVCGSLLAAVLLSFARTADATPLSDTPGSSISRPGDADARRQSVMSTLPGEAVTPQQTFGVAETSAVNAVQSGLVAPAMTVPESGIVALLGLGLFGIAATIRRQGRR